MFMTILDYTVLFLKETAGLFIDMAPYLTLGILLAGFMHAFLSKDFVANHIGGNNVFSVLKAALFGVPLPLCSCGVVPTAVYLKNSGASKSAVLSFLISTPQTGVDSIAATWGMLGPLFAFFRAAAAFITGLAGGLADLIIERTEKSSSVNNNLSRSGSVLKEPSPDKIGFKTTEDRKYYGLFGKLRKIFDYAVFELLDDIAVNFLIGLIVAAVISLVIPENFFTGSFLSNPLISMLFMVIVGIPMYICSTSSIPIAVVMIAKGLSPGAAYVFLVAGPATNAASLAIITKALGRKTTVRYLVTIITGSLAFGFVMDLIYSRIGLSPFGGAEHHIHADQTEGVFSIAVSVLFLIMLSGVFYRKLKAGKASRKNPGVTGHLMKEDEMTKIGIEGMSCGHCTASVEKALSMVKGIEKIDVSLEGGCALLEGDFNIGEAEAAIENAGYSVSGNNRS